MRFEDLELMQPLLRAIEKQGYTEPTPIQVQAIPHISAGRDLIGLAQTGTGKTAAFALPVLQYLLQNDKKKRPIRVLVLAPTRELASQIAQSFKDYGHYTPLNQMTIFGGVNQKRQVKQINKGVDIVVATPGRLLDLMNQKLVHFSGLDVLVLDEADRMFDMGFLPDIKRIISRLPKQRQNLLFSATMPSDIKALASTILQDPVTVAVTPQSTPVEAIEQQVFFVDKSDKRKLLQHLLNKRDMQRTLVFTRTKHGADRLSKQLNKADISAGPIHGNKSQASREKTLARFKSGQIQVLVATDIVARGIDVDDISHVVNYDLPNETESYVHRIGRTGRAGAEGIALSFCSADEQKYLKAIQRLIETQIPVQADHPFASAQAAAQPAHNNSKKNGSKYGNNKKRRKSRRRNNRSNSQPNR